MKIYFVTGNRFKYELMKKVMSPDFEVEWLKPVGELEEPKEREVEKVVMKKLESARRMFPDIKEFIFITDVGLHFEALDGRPGALIKRETRERFGGDFSKWCEVVKGSNREAKVVVAMGAIDKQGRKVIVKHEVYGKISEKPAKGEYGFDWDEIFIPDWDKEELKGKSFAQVPEEEKQRIMLIPLVEKFKRKMKEVLI